MYVEHWRPGKLSIRMRDRSTCQYDQGLVSENYGTTKSPTYANSGLRLTTDVRGHHENDDDNGKFDLEDQVDGVMESTEASGRLGAPRALLAYVLKVYSNHRNLGRTRWRTYGSWDEVRFLMSFWLCFVIRG